MVSIPSLLRCRRMRSKPTASRSTYASAGMVRRLLCCTASAQRATCGATSRTLIEDHTIVAPDLRGLGLSSKPDGGYDKKNQVLDVVGVLDALGVRTAEFVTHDIGIMVGFAIAATHPERMSRWVAIDAPLPGVGPWDQITQDPAMWHFGFGGSDMERLVAGRERIYLDRFWNELSRDPKRFDDAKRQHYAQPGAIRAGFAQFL